MTPPSSAHLLLVDDDPEIIALLQTALSQDGFTVSAAADGNGMRAVLRQERIDLIVLDVMLPDEDGLSLC